MKKAVANSAWINIGIIAIFFLAVWIVFRAGYAPARPVANLNNDEASSEVSSADDLERPLTLERDAERFLKVYLNQQFATPEEKQVFVGSEYARLSARKRSEAGGEQLDELLAVLQRVLEKYEHGGTDFSVEDAQLVDLLLLLENGSEEI